MNKVRDLYQKADLSQEKRAQLKAQFRERFPQYAKDESGMEEIVMNKSIINDPAPVKVKTRAIAGIAAALVIAAGGTAYIIKNDPIDTDSGSSSVSANREDDPKENVFADRNSSAADEPSAAETDISSRISANDSDVQTDAAAESTAETEMTAYSQQTEDKMSEPDTRDIPTTETQREDGTVTAVSENNDTSKPQTEEDIVTTTVTAVTTEEPLSQPDTTTAVIETDESVQPAEVFKMLDSLDYHAISCDGLPEYTLAAPDGTLYLLNFSEGGTQPGWVWRRPSLIADADNEAPLTQEVIDAIHANWDKLNIYPCEWN